MFIPSLCCLCYTAGVKVLSSLPLQMLMYFNIYYSPMWAIAGVLGLILKVWSKEGAKIRVQLMECAQCVHEKIDVAHSYEHVLTQSMDVCPSTSTTLPTWDALPLTARSIKAVAPSLHACYASYISAGV